MNAAATEFGVPVVHVYIREAHAVDGWAISDNEGDEGTCFRQPRSTEERLERAGEFAASRGVEHLVVDPIENGVERAYEARPERIYVLERGEDGIVVGWRTGIGPYQYSVEALNAYLARP